MQQPSMDSGRGASQGGASKYAHSPYVFSTSIEDAHLSLSSDYAVRREAAGLSTYMSPQLLSVSTSTQDVSVHPALTSMQSEGGHQLSQPTTPLSRCSGAQEFSQPIRVVSAPNVHPRYRRRLQSPTAHGGSNASCTLTAFPNTPPSSLPPRSPFVPRDDSVSAFTVCESAPMRVHSSRPYQVMVNYGRSSPQCGVLLSASSRSTAAEVDSGSQSPNLLYTAHGTPPLPMGSASPMYVSQTFTPHMSPTAANGPLMACGAPVGLSMPLKMSSAMNSGGSGGRLGSPGELGGSQSPSYADPRSNQSFSSTMGVSNGAPPPPFAAAMQKQQQQQGSSFSTGNYHSQVGSGCAYPGSALFGGTRMGGGPTELLQHASPHFASDMSDTFTRTMSTGADETMSFSSKSSSSTSGIRADLPLCPNDDACTLINDRKHQRKYVHTCRLHPCYHGHVARHAKLFRHSPGQVSAPDGVSANMKVSSQALASVNFSNISPEAPNAYRIYVSHGEKSYEIFGDWASVKVHTLKRYLHQVYHIAPRAQILSVATTGKVMDDDINNVKSFGIEEDSVVQLQSSIEDASSLRRLGISLEDL
ncbi:hypothetical protein LSCM1_05612 [Leishmania martiniquensis]|uniref:Ubiquitin-like domain-containing protein n=1 Tax=Leishmania martiniquensis TaxID=1580590 RepID=A0A836HS24_9TRYP|nr:hypothetical protein LSCM1_05612 [Leishmania martiniquensis]